MTTHEYKLRVPAKEADKATELCSTTDGNRMPSTVLATHVIDLGDNKKVTIQVTTNSTPGINPCHVFAKMFTADHGVLLASFRSNQFLSKFSFHYKGDEYVVEVVRIDSYHFSMGDSNDGPIGLCARVLAESPEHAVAELWAAFDKYQEINLRRLLALPDEIEYANVYINPNHFNVVHIDETGE